VCVEGQSVLGDGGGGGGGGSCAVRGESGSRGFKATAQPPEPYPVEKKSVT